jgi:gas vesicle protein
MFPAIISTLAAKGLSDLGGMLLDTIINQGADKAEDIVKDVTGLDIDFNHNATKEDIDAIEKHSDAIMDALSHIKEENRHEEVMAKAEIERAEVDNKDRSDAREMGTRLMLGDDRIIRYFIPFFTVLIFVTGTFIAYSVIFNIVPTGNRDLATTMLGAVIGWIGSSIHYWLSTGNTSAKKDEALLHYAKQK